MQGTVEDSASSIHCGRVRKLLDPAAINTSAVAHVEVLRPFVQAARPLLVMVYVALAK